MSRSGDFAEAVLMVLIGAVGLLWLHCSEAKTPPCSASPGMDRSQVIDACGVPERTAEDGTRSWWTYPGVVVEIEGAVVRSVKQ